MKQRLQIPQIQTQGDSRSQGCNALGKQSEQKVASAGIVKGKKRFKQNSVISFDQFDVQFFSNTF